jgi:DNA invertase Pin-like site-specific DNA recombinase
MKINRGAVEMKSDLDTLQKLEMEISECGGEKELGEIYSVSRQTVNRWKNRLISHENVERRLH